MKIKILQRLENYKKHRQEWIDKQQNHQWTMKERETGSELLGLYHEKEQLFNTKILELEWVLSLFEEETPRRRKIDCEYYCSDECDCLGEYCEED